MTCCFGQGMHAGGRKPGPSISNNSDDQIEQESDCSNLATTHCDMLCSNLSQRQLQWVTTMLASYPSCLIRVCLSRKWRNRISPDFIVDHQLQSVLWRVRPDAQNFMEGSWLTNIRLVQRGMDADHGRAHQEPLACPLFRESQEFKVPCLKPKVVRHWVWF